MESHFYRVFRWVYFNNIFFWEKPITQRRTWQKFASDCSSLCFGFYKSVNFKFWWLYRFGDPFKGSKQLAFYNCLHINKTESPRKICIHTSSDLFPTNNCPKLTDFKLNLEAANIQWSHSVCAVLFLPFWTGLVAISCWGIDFY